MVSTSETVLFAVGDDRVATITLNRPEALNATARRRSAPSTSGCAGSSMAPKGENRVR
jgi:hypothetical protein